MSSAGRSAVRAAVMHRPGEPLQLADLELDPPGDGEVEVRIIAAGVCHSDVHYLTGDLPSKLPVVLGHEGEGGVGRAIVVP